VITVPRTAITYSLYGNSVYAVKAQPAADGKAKDGAGPSLVAERRFVKTGQVRDERVAVLDGVQDGEQIVTTGQLKLNPGAAIRVDNSQLIKPYEQRPKQ
jgi:membrane fusion protein (multidrug efflux system)